MSTWSCKHKHFSRTWTRVRNQDLNLFRGPVMRVTAEATRRHPKSFRKPRKEGWPAGNPSSVPCGGQKDETDPRSSEAGFERMGGIL